MEVKLVGVSDPLSRNKLRDFAQWLGDKLIGGKLVDNIKLNIIIKKFQGPDAHFHGFAEWEDSNVRPREFNILMNANMEEELLLETLAHEMVHVKQDARGERKERYKGGHRLFWKGKDHTKTPYSKQPWEREAYRLEKKLLAEYLSRG